MLGGGVVGPRVGLRLLGAGSFGGYIATLLRKYPARHNFEVLPPFTRSSGLAWEADVLRDGKTEAVYICTPDAQHGPQAIACLGAGKAVLVEKPVLGWAAVRDAAQAAGARGWVHVGFQRRHDSEYLRARAHCATHAVRRAVFVAEDPWDADANMVKDPEQLRNVLRDERWQYAGSARLSAVSCELYSKRCKTQNHIVRPCDHKLISVRSAYFSNPSALTDKTPVICTYQLVPMR